jgi:hypothetical protein
MRQGMVAGHGQGLTRREGVTEPDSWGLTGGAGIVIGRMSGVGRDWVGAILRYGFPPCAAAVLRTARIIS